MGKSKKVFAQIAIISLIIFAVFNSFGANPVTASASDVDEDGILNLVDNCAQIANPDQTDTDDDGLGDVCDDYVNEYDVDEDGVLNAVDNCVFVSNPDQINSDGDAEGDACDIINDLDWDDDLVANDQDNCPEDANADQTDTDDDGLGDECDGAPAVSNLDVDEDGVTNANDNCPTTVNPAQTDQDLDGMGDPCDQFYGFDVDEDGVLNGDDNCYYAANAGQADLDSDGQGDACDFYVNSFDVDEDGVLNGDDNCQWDENADQADEDGDGLGDVCDETSDDADGDLIADDVDNCPEDENSNQADSNNDGVGDACSPNTNTGGGLPPAAFSAPVAPPGGFSMVINHGGIITNNPNVVLSFNVGTDINRMALSNSASFDGEGQQLYLQNKEWNLCWQYSSLRTPTTCPAGTYTIYGQFYTSWGQPSPKVSATIVYDPTGANKSEILSSGSLVLENGTIYLIMGQQKYGFANMESFLGLGYSLKNVKRGSTHDYSAAFVIGSPTVAHMPGSFIINGITVYFVTNSGIIPIPTWETFLINGGRGNLILPANEADLLKPMLGVMIDSDPRVTY